MTTRLNPYVNFRGQAGEAMAFYQSVLGGDLTSTTFGELGGMGTPEEEHGHLMHSQLSASESVTLMGSDLPSTMPGDIHNGTISLSGDDEAQLRGWYDGLAAGGTVDVPLEQAPWGDFFGQVTDKFGVSWMVNVAGPGQGAS